MSKPSDFFAGVCVALQHVTNQDNGVIWKEIVKTCGIDDLLYYAAHTEPDEWELAGFRMYARSELGKSKPRKKRPTSDLGANAQLQGTTSLGRRALDLAIASLLGYRPDPHVDMRWYAPGEGPDEWTDEEDIPRYSLHPGLAEEAQMAWISDLPEPDRLVRSATMKAMLRAPTTPGLTEAERICYAMIFTDAVVKTRDEILNNKP